VLFLTFEFDLTDKIICGILGATIRKQQGILTTDYADIFRKYLTGPALRYDNKHMSGSMNHIALVLGRTKNIPVFLLMALIMAALGSFLVYIGKRSITERRARIAHYSGGHEFTGKPAVFIGCVQLLLGALALLAAVSFLISIFS
jgi:hypothetical protein